MASLFFRGSALLGANAGAASGLGSVSSLQAAMSSSSGCFRRALHVASASSMSLSVSRAMAATGARRSVSILASSQEPGSGSSNSADSAHLIAPAHHKGSHTLHPLRAVDATTSEAPLPRMGLNEEERSLHNKARRNGYLSPTSRGTTDALRAMFFHSCQLDQRPYVAVDPHGNSVYVDATTAAGKGKNRDFSVVAAALAKMERSLATAIATGSPAFSSLQVMNTDALAEQSKKLSIGVLEGSNSFKSSPAKLSATAEATSTSLASSFYVFTGSKGQAIAVARELAMAAPPASSSSAALDRPTAEAARQRKLEEVRARRVLLMQKKLRKLVQDPIRVKNLRVKAGVLDGFLRSSAVGSPATTSPPS